MCQAYEGERNYILASEAFDRKKGYEAFHAGRARDSVSWEQDNCYLPSDVYHWQLGYDTAAAGRELW